MSSSFDTYVSKKLEDPIFREEYDALEPEFSIIHAMIDARKKSGLTQKDLADKTGLSQGDISKIERGNGNPSLNTLKRLAEGMEMSLQLVFVPMAVSETGQRELASH